MRACRKYWLIAVSSFLRILLRCAMTSTSPFMGTLRLQAAEDAADAAVTSQEACGAGARESRGRVSRISRAQGAQGPQHVATPVQDCSCSNERAPSWMACCRRFSEIPWQRQTYIGR